ncbi:bifunctional metallophosphatase/5'-nucleotidase [Geothrix alkalitolerans]|uniref:bifunctional metallophosphatase/5'-nucleotidase n=1 Tax=Geothrix alkalitolerans TaxID=2922724 RepID=UPI001FAF4D5B|nr:metallophosphoesterase [Geothrix alkalitolerans]
MDRRHFLASLGAAAVASQVPLKAAEAPAAGRITLLHTNDTHSRIEPFGPGNGAISGKGGMARRATLVKQLRSQLGPVLLLDAGDTFQGTPYFNRYKGRLDYQLMRMIGYDATTLGNHDFDNGVEMLVEAMASMEKLQHRNPPFAFLNCNFDCQGAPELARRIRPYMVREFPGMKVGITGVGVAFAGLVAPKNHEGIIWKDPFESLKPVVKRLREVEKVDLVVVLSHLGYDVKDAAHDDLRMPGRVAGIDAIIGGHSHTFLDAPVKVKQAQGETLVFQVGFGGVNLGRMDFTLARGEVRAASGAAMPVVG